VQSAKPAGTRSAQSTKPASTKPASTRPPQNGGKKKKGKLGKDGILALIMLFLVVVLAAVIIICCVKAIADTVGGTTGSSGTTGTTGPAKTDMVYAAPNEGDWNYGFITEEIDNNDVFKGNLILVNNSHKTIEASSKDLVNVYGLPNRTYSLSGSDFQLHNSIIPQLNAMLAAMKAENSATLSSGDKILLSSGFRTVERQTTLYEEAVAQGKNTVAKPEHSEHHTGLTFDIKIYTSKGATVDLRPDEQKWLEENCAKYGFILRYPEDKIGITQISEESWHFRYVGVAHATYMTNADNNLCLEEYITLIRDQHSYDKAPLSVTDANGTSYTIYYIPASVEKDVTTIYHPEATSYEISGNNVDGFIITVTHSSN
jgi:D-alanyl-D-alanine carboxypeptidase